MCLAKKGVLRMRRIVLLLAVLAALVLASGVALAQAERPFRETVPIEGVYENPCTGEGVFIEGTFKFLLRAGQDEAGGSHDFLHTSLQGEGVTDDGARVIINASGVESGNFRFADPDSADTFTSALPGSIIRQGETTTTEDDFLAHIQYKLTVDANGERTVELVRFDLECV
jgi:hypothetical protein